MTGQKPFRPRVLHVGKYYWPVRGGIENYLYHLCNRLNGRTDLRVLVSSVNLRYVREKVNGVDVERVPRYAEVASTAVSPGLIRRLKETDADVIHVHVPNPMAEVAYLLAKPRGKLVLTWHSDVIRQKALYRLYRGIGEAFLRRASRIISTAPQNVENSPVLSRFRDRTRVIPLGTDPDDFLLTPGREPRVAELRARFGPRVILFVGRLIYYKGVEYLIRAMPKVDAHVVIGSEGPLKEPLEALARGLGVASKVTFAGNISDEDLPCYYLASDVFCLPSVARSEAFGIVQLEAMAAGIPVVNTSLKSGVVYVSPDGVTGLTVPPADPEALAAALNRLLGDEALRRRLGEQGRIRVRSEFTHDLTAQRTFDLYREVLGG
jgi:rhamnosyl/mannosyltransferase